MSAVLLPLYAIWLPASIRFMWYIESQDIIIIIINIIMYVFSFNSAGNGQ